MSRGADNNAERASPTATISRPVTRISGRASALSSSVPPAGATSFEAEGVGRQTSAASTRAEQQERIKSGRRSRSAEATPASGMDADDAGDNQPRTLSGRVILNDGAAPTEEEEQADAAEEEAEAFLEIERHLDHESPFEVRPSCGVLAPASDTEFLLTFCPSAIGEFHNVVELVLQCIPDLDGGEKKKNMEVEDATAASELQQQQQHAALTAAAAALVGEQNEAEVARTEATVEPTKSDNHYNIASTPLPQLHPHHLLVQQAGEQPHQQQEDEEAFMPAPSLSDFFSALPKTAEDLALKELRVAEFEVKGKTDRSMVGLL